MIVVMILACIKFEQLNKNKDNALNEYKQATLSKISALISLVKT